MPVYDPLTSGPPVASVILPCYQGARFIRDALRALLRQTTSIVYEMIVVDSSTDGTDRIIEQEFPMVRLLHFAERCQVGKARNLGIEAAQGDVIVFMDVDTIPVAGWLDQMYRGIRYLGADAVGGAMSNGTPWSATGSAGFYLEFFRFVAYDAEPHPTRFLVGGNSGFRRDLLKNIEYQDQSVGEDMLLSGRLAQEGKRLLFLPRAAIEHQNRTGLRTVLSYQYKLGQGAFFYRSAESPGKVRLLMAAPPVVFLLPFAVMILIGATLLRRRRFGEFFRFTVLLPLCWVGNLAWALGLYRSLRQARHDTQLPKRVAAIRE